MYSWLSFFNIILYFIAILNFTFSISLIHSLCIYLLLILTFFELLFLIKQKGSYRNKENIRAVIFVALNVIYIIFVW